MGVSRDCPNILGTPIISGTGKATDFKFGGYRANPNKSPLKILEKRERGRIQGVPKFLGYPLLSQEQVKLRTSNFVRTFIASIGIKAHKNVGNSSDGRSQGVPKISGHPCIGRIGALRGHLCNSTAFLCFMVRLQNASGYSINIRVWSGPKSKRQYRPNTSNMHGFVPNNKHHG